MSGVFDKLRMILGTSEALNEEASSDMAETKIIVGLGNPGKEYDGTRHNAGFDVIDILAEKCCIAVKQKKFGGFVGDGEVYGKKVLLVKPLQYMNLSGQVVATVTGFYKLKSEDVIVITDDMALEPGRIRLRAKGSAGGHNGLQDIISKLGTDSFCRVRVGIGKDPVIPTKSYVLGRPSADDRGLISDACQRAADSVLCWTRDGIDLAMNKFNVNNK